MVSYVFWLTNSHTHILHKQNVHDDVLQMFHNINKDFKRYLDVKELLHTKTLSYAFSFCLRIQLLMTLQIFKTDGYFHTYNGTERLLLLSGTS